jgi:type I restriction enzyme S subunit
MAGDAGAAALRDLLITTKDGDWGKETPAEGLVPYRVIRGTDFPSVRLGDTSSVPVRYLTDSTVHRRTLAADDILLETAGGSPGRPTGRSLLVTRKLLASLDLPVTCASFARFLRVDRNKADPQYVFWFLQYLYSSGQMEEHQVQHTGVARFQYTKFAESQEIPLPPRAEQRAIAHILGTLDDKIELNRRMNETLEAMARALFKSWFVDFDPVRAKAEGRDTGLPREVADLFPDSFEDSELGEIPKGWGLQSFAVTVDISGGGTPKTSVPEYWDGDIPWFSVVDVPSESDVWVVDTEKHVTRQGIENSATRVLPEGTTIISARGTVGKVALVGVEMAMNQSCYGLIPKGRQKGFFSYFATRSLVTQLLQRAHGSVFDTITRETLSGLSVVAPPSQTLLLFEGMIQPILHRIRVNLHFTRTLATVRDTLLPKLISGELRVKDAERFVDKHAQ